MMLLHIGTSTSIGVTTGSPSGYYFKGEDMCYQKKIKKKKSNGSHFEVMDEINDGVKRLNELIKIFSCPSNEIAP